MIGTWLLLLALVAAIWAWMRAFTARECAIRHGRELCREAGVQLLDHTVSLGRMRIVRHGGHLALLRRYGFDVSLDGSDRHHCHLDLIGANLEGWSIPLGPGREAPTPLA